MTVATVQNVVRLTSFVPPDSVGRFETREPIARHEIRAVAEQRRQVIEPATLFSEPSCRFGFQYATACSTHSRELRHTLECLPK